MNEPNGPTPLRLLILEDNPSDLRRAADLAKQAGFDRFEINVSSTAAVNYLDDTPDGHRLGSI